MLWCCQKLQQQQQKISWAGISLKVDSDVYNMSYGENSLKSMIES